MVGIDVVIWSSFSGCWVKSLSIFPKLTNPMCLCSASPDVLWQSQWTVACEPIYSRWQVAAMHRHAAPVHQRKTNRCQAQLHFRNHIRHKLKHKRIVHCHSIGQIRIELTDICSRDEWLKFIHCGCNEIWITFSIDYLAQYLLEICCNSSISNVHNSFSTILNDYTYVKGTYHHFRPIVGSQCPFCDCMAQPNQPYGTSYKPFSNCVLWVWPERMSTKYLCWAHKFRWTFSLPMHSPWWMDSIESRCQESTWWTKQKSDARNKSIELIVKIGLTKQLQTCCQR